MAKVILSPLLSRLSGKLGNSVFAFYKGVQVVREMPAIVTNPSSPAQVLARAGFGVFGDAWRTLSEADKGLWEQLGRKQFSASDSNAVIGSGQIVGETIGPLSGYNAFIQVNMNRLMSGLAPLGDVRTDAPLGLKPPPPLKTLTALQVGSTLQVTWTTISVAPTTNRIEIWLKSIGAKIHNQLIYTADAVPNATAIISYVRGVSGLLISPPPGTYKIQAQVVNNEGLVSTSTEILYVILSDNFNPVYFEPRELLVQILNADINSPWITLSVAGLVPVATNAIIVYAEIEPSFAGAYGAQLLLRKDATQDVCMRKVVAGYAAIGIPFADNGIIPITSAREFDYLYSCATVPGDLYNVRIYAIGYIY